MMLVAGERATHSAGAQASSRRGPPRPDTRDRQVGAARGPMFSLPLRRSRGARRPARIRRPRRRASRPARIEPRRRATRGHPATPGGNCERHRSPPSPVRSSSRSPSRAHPPSRNGRLETLDRVQEPHAGNLHQIVERLPAVHVSKRELAGEGDEAVDELVAGAGVVVGVVNDEELLVVEARQAGRRDHGDGQWDLSFGSAENARSVRQAARRPVRPSHRCVWLGRRDREPRSARPAPILSPYRIRKNSIGTAARG
jgi:hypothetical protein